jgi:hypothetical protein
LAKLDPVDLAGRDFNGQGCTVTAAAPDAAVGGGVIVSCKELRLLEVIETGGATAELDIRGSLEAVGALADAIPVEAADIPGGKGRGDEGGKGRGALAMALACGEGWASFSGGGCYVGRSGKEGWRTPEGNL